MMIALVIVLAAVWAVSVSMDGQRATPAYEADREAAKPPMPWLDVALYAIGAWAVLWVASRLLA